MRAEEAVEKCEGLLGYRFKDSSILLRALTHSSAGGDNNERLEFLGDAVVGMVVAETLLRMFPKSREGKLTQMKSAIVNREFQARLAEELGLGEVAHLGGGVKLRRGASRAVLSNLLEAVIGGIYADGGLEAAREFTEVHMSERIMEELERFSAKDSKSRLQEFAQQRMGAAPTYEILEEEGPDHQKRFRAVTVISGNRYESAWGESKRDAERRAAGKTLKKLTAEGKDG